jgi:succinate dehydrogenase / fumarate reductase membrane anchor subunit
MANRGAARKPERIVVMRSQLGRARGLGAAHAGAEHWWAERVTAVALVPLTVWFVISVLRMLGAGQQEVAAWAGQPLNAALLLALVGMMFHHTQLGMQVVYEDYIDDIMLRHAATLVTKGLCLVLALMAAVAVVKMSMAVPAAPVH